MLVHLHVGVPCSGSSAIQEFCRLNPDLLARFGEVYPALPPFSAKLMIMALRKAGKAAFTACRGIYIHFEKFRRLTRSAPYLAFICPALAHPLPDIPRAVSRRCCKTQGD